MLQWNSIVCPIDFSDAAREAMHLAADIASRHGAALHLVHIYQVPGISFPEATVYSGQEALEKLLDATGKELAAWRAEARSMGADRVETHAIMGVPYSEIIRFVRNNHCDLLVLGTHGRTALMRALMGSVAEKVVRHAPCPVLTVRPQRAHVAEEVGAETQTQ